MMFNKRYVVLALTFIYNARPITHVLVDSASFHYSMGLLSVLLRAIGEVDELA